MAMGRDLLVGKAAELVPHQRQRLVAESRLQRRVAGEAFGKPLARGGGIAVANQRGHGRRAKRRQRPVVELHVAGPDNLALAHGDAAGHLREVLAERRLQHEGFRLAQPAGRGATRRPAAHLAQRLDICGEPGKAMGGELFALERCGVDSAVDAYPGRHRPARVAFQGFGGGQRVRGEVEQGFDGDCRAGFHGHALIRSRLLPRR